MRTNKKLTGTREDYIRAMYKIGGFKKNSIRVGDLAEYLGLAKSTVSERVKELIAIAFVAPDAESTGYVLTSKGLETAKNLTYKHRIIESFLYEVLGLSEEKLHQEAELLEHACSDEVIEKMAMHLGNPSEDPHGQPIRK